MEPLWSPVVATGGSQSQIRSAEKRQEQAKTVAVGCDQLRSAAHGKEGVDSSSPFSSVWSEGKRQRGLERESAPLRVRGCVGVLP